MGKDIKKYSADGIVHFDIAEQLRQMNRQNSTSRSGRQDEFVIFDNCLRQIYDIHFDLNHCRRKEISEETIVVQLDRLIDKDPQFIWEHIPRLFAQKTKTSDFHEILRLTIRIRDLFGKTTLNRDLGDQIWDLFLKHAALGAFDKLPEEFLRCLCDEIVAGNLKESQICWSAIITPKSDFEKYVALIETTLLKGSTLLEFLPELFEKAEDSRYEQLDEEGLDADLTRLENLKECYQQILLDMNSSAVLLKFLNKTDLNSQVFIKLLDLLIVGESGFHALTHSGLKDHFVAFLQRELVESEVISYLVHNPQFLVWLKEQDKNLDVSTQFLDQYVDLMLAMEEKSQAARFETLIKLFNGRLPDRFHQVQFEMLSTQLINKEIENDLEKNLTQLIYGFCSEAVLALTVKHADEVCDRISALAVKHRVKSQSFHAAWMKLNESVQQGKIYPLDEAIAIAYLKDLPKHVSAERLMNFSARLASTDLAVDKAIRLIARLIFREKRIPVVISSEFLKKMHRIDLNRNYEAIQELFKDLLTLCNHIHNGLKKSKQKVTHEVKEFFGAFLDLLEKNPEVKMNGQFWDGVVAVGKEIGLLAEGKPTGKIAEIDQRLLLAAFTQDLKRLNDRKTTVAQLFDILHYYLGNSRNLTDEMKSKVVQALSTQIDKYTAHPQEEMMLVLIQLLSDENVVQFLSSKPLFDKCKVALIQFLRLIAGAMPEDKLECCIEIAEKYRTASDEILNSVIETLTVRFNKQGALTQSAAEMLDRTIQRFNIFTDVQANSIGLCRSFFKLGLVAYSRPDFTEVSRILELRHYFAIELLVKKYDLVLEGMSDYAYLLAKYLDQLAGEDQSILLGYYLIAVNSEALSTEFLNKFSFADLQMNLLRLFSNIQLEGLEVTSLIGYLISEHGHSKYDEEFEPIVEQFLKSPKVMKLGMSDDLLNRIQHAVEINKFNTNRLLKFINAYFLSDVNDDLEPIEFIVEAFVTSIKKGRKIHDKNLLKKMAEAMVNFSPDDYDTQQIARCTRCLVNLIACPMINKLFLETTQEKIMDMIVENMVIILDFDYQNFEDEVVALKDRMNTVLGDRSKLLNIDFQKLLERKKSRDLLLGEVVEISRVTIADPFTLGLLAIGKLMDYLDTSQATKRSHAAHLDSELEEILDYDDLDEVHVNIPFQGRQRSDFLLKFIKELIGYSWSTEGGINEFTIFYIWELIKDYKKHFPKKSLEINDLIMEFVFLPQKMSLNVAQLHYTLCCAWIIGSPKLVASNDDHFKLIAYTDPKLIIPNIRDKLAAGVLYEFFLRKQNDHSSVYNLICLDFLSQLQGLQPDQYLFSIQSDTYLNFFLAIKLDPDDVESLAKIYPNFHSFIPNIMFKESVAPLIKAHVAGILVIYFDLCHRGVFQQFNSEEIQKCRDLRDSYLEMILNQGWVTKENRIYKLVENAIAD